MKIDVSKSSFHEALDVNERFDWQQARHLRVLLRRLRFLESRVQATGGLRDGGENGGAAWAELEADALAFALDRLGFLAPRDKTSV